jgi:nucleotide-binding universal stress UspA family protein
MIPRIVVPLDGSGLAEQVLPYVKIISKPAETPVVLVQAVPDSEKAPGREARAYLEGVAESLRQDGLQVSCKVAEGAPASAIVREAREEPGTLIAMSSQARAGITRWVAGSVTDQVLQSTTAPLLIIRSQETGEREAGDRDAQVRLTDLVVPLDGSDLAEEVLPLAVDLARGLGLKITALRVTPSPEEYHHSPEYPPLSSFDDLAREVDEEALAYLQQVVQRLLGQGVPVVEERLVHGAPAGAIIEYVRELPHSLTAMTTRGRSGIGRMMLGSVADRVVRDSGSPVLLVRAGE